MTIEERVRENRLRRMAERQGLTLQKSRRRDPRAHDFGRFWLLEAGTGRRTRRLAQGNGLDVDQVEGFLTGTEG